MTEIPIGTPPLLWIMMFFTAATTLQFFMFGSALAANELAEPVECSIEFSFTGFAGSVTDCISDIFNFTFGIIKTILNFITLNVPGAPTWLRLGAGLINGTIVSVIVVGLAMLVIRLVGEIIDAVSPF